MLRFNRLAAGEQILVRMGMSFISPDQACSNADEEIPTFDFEDVSQSSISQFETLLNRIRVESTNVTNDTLILFYSSVRSLKSYADIVISNFNITTELYRRKSSLGYERAYIRFILLYLGYFSIFPSIIQYLRS